jgi:hypothetical protein
VTANHPSASEALEAQQAAKEVLCAILRADFDTPIPFAAAGLRLLREAGAISDRTAWFEKPVLLDKRGHELAEQWGINTISASEGNAQP